MKRLFFSLIAGIVTIFSVCFMLEINKMNVITNSESLQYNNSMAEDDSYDGYIFDDYNINVNLNFRDKDEKTVRNDKLDSFTASKDGSNTADIMKMIRSEKIIEEKAIKDSTDTK